MQRYEDTEEPIALTQARELICDLGKVKSAQGVIDLLYPEFNRSLSNGLVNDNVLRLLITALKRLKKTQDVDDVSGLAYDQNPSSLYVARERVNALIAQKRYDEATTLAEKLKKDPKNSIYGALAHARISQRNMEILKAIEILETAEANCEDCPFIIYNELGKLTRLTSHDISVPLRYFTKALELNPRSNQQIQDLAIISMEYADSLVGLNPDEVFRQRRIALILFQRLSDQSQFRRRIAFLEKSITDDHSQTIFTKSGDYITIASAQDVEMPNDGLVRVFSDGSYNENERKIGIGVVVLLPDKPEPIIYSVSVDATELSADELFEGSLASEFMAVTKAIDLTPENAKLVIHVDNNAVFARLEGVRNLKVLSRLGAQTSRRFDDALSKRDAPKAVLTSQGPLNKTPSVQKYMRLAHLAAWRGSGSGQVKVGYTFG